MENIFLIKSEENLCIADLSFERDCYNACVNRAYYAVLQAAIAALEKEGIKEERVNHAWVQSEFNGKLIKRRKKYPSKLKSTLTELQLSRNIADYKNKCISKKIALKRLASAREMIDIIKKELKNEY